MLSSQPRANHELDPDLLRDRDEELDRQTTHAPAFHAARPAGPEEEEPDDVPDHEDPDDGMTEEREQHPAVERERRRQRRQGVHV